MAPNTGEPAEGEDAEGVLDIDAIVDPRGSPTPAPPALRSALAHDWVCAVRGGEAVLDRLARLLTVRTRLDTLYVLTDDGRSISPAIDALTRVPSALQRIPAGPGPLRRWLLPLYPWGVSGLSRRLARDHARRAIDLLVSTSSAAIKGLRPPEGVPHVCYCHSPARYLWARRDDYAGGVRGLGLAGFAPALRAWDRRTSAHVTRFVANSTHIARQIERCYGREADVVFPPVDVGFFTPDAGTPRTGDWLCVGALEPYKRVDLAIRAAGLAGRRLVVVGEGSQRARLERLARDLTPRGLVVFEGRAPRPRLRELYRSARALLFPQVEDFGIVAVEAQACGTPVIARREGGALDSVLDGTSGAFFDEPTPQALSRAALDAPEPGPACRASAERFAPERFDAAMGAILDGALRRGR